MVSVTGSNQILKAFSQSTMSGKEQAVANLFASGNDESAKKKILIEELDSTRTSSDDRDGSDNGSENSDATTKISSQSTPSPPKVVPLDEGPSIMEQMMAAQQQAKKKDDIVKAKQQAKEEKKALGGGFKKGFFGGSAASKVKKTPTTTSSSSSSSSSGSKSSSDKDHIPTITKRSGVSSSGSGSGKGQGGKGVVLDDVQRALREDEEKNPLLQQLKGGEWANDDLMSKLQSDPVLSRGLLRPRCQEALQLMQTNPMEAKKKYEHDPEVAGFMRAFSALMADHFTKLGESQTQTQTQPSAPPIPEGNVEVGVLHAEAIARQQQQQQGGRGVVSEVNVEEEARVKEIVQDEELRDMLMDPSLQRILQECNDPHKFQMHMRDPVTAYKIKKLFDAGLVGTAK